MRNEDRNLWEQFLAEAVQWPQRMLKDYKLKNILFGVIDDAPVEQLSQELIDLAELSGGKWIAPCGCGPSDRPKLACSHDAWRLMTWVCYDNKHSHCKGGLVTRPITGCQCVCHAPWAKEE